MASDLALATSSLVNPFPSAAHSQMSLGQFGPGLVDQSGSLLSSPAAAAAAAAAATAAARAASGPPLFAGHMFAGPAAQKSAQADFAASSAQTMQANVAATLGAAGLVQQQQPAQLQQHQQQQQLQVSGATTPIGGRPAAAAAVAPTTADSFAAHAKAFDGHAHRLAAASGHLSGWCLFVYNLAPEVEENVVWKLFGPFGAVQSVNLVKDAQTNKCKGFAFVTMSDYNQALMAVQSLNGCTLANRVLQVSFKTSKVRKTMPSK